MTRQRWLMLIVLVNGLNLGCCLGYNLHRSDPVARFNLATDEEICLILNDPNAQRSPPTYAECAMALELREYRKVYGPLGPSWLDTELRGAYTPPVQPTPAGACKFCERSCCDGDCMACDNIDCVGIPRKTAAQFRAEGRRQGHIDQMRIVPRREPALPPAGGFATAEEATANMPPIAVLGDERVDPDVIVIRNNGSIPEPELKRRLAELQSRSLPLKLEQMQPDAARIKLLEDGLNEACNGWERQYNRDLPANPRADIARLRKLADGDAALHGPGDGRCSDEACSCHRW